MAFKLRRASDVCACSMIVEENWLQMSPELLVKENKGATIRISKPHNSLKTHLFVPGTCCIIAVIKVAFIFVGQVIFSLETGHITKL